MERILFVHRNCICFVLRVIVHLLFLAVSRDFHTAGVTIVLPMVIAAIALLL